ncbi:phosphoserine phosphatase SerB [Hydrogenovibrio sp. SC-1]|uniref:phosphoserine phosphatase SerB n=1 Tax=Hydrogenovibrio sp. SC-1 TaxID=2065820 RepID=UPI000C7BA279|nr:phosphoserine phosphatase SerB [Hydrogenovibrio sp. SC-1]PLA74107.1 phosphoserine phosphatase SerB [Hydrogenovibrio sp. SC-1]
MTTLIIHENGLTYEQSKQITRSLGTPEKVNNHYRIRVNDYCAKTTQALSQKIGIDINPLPAGFNGNNIQLVISDMDSTLIGIECVDEIADMMNLKPQVAAITEAAMRGECDFESSLTQRVALLEGLNTQALQTVFDERLFLNPGAEVWLQGLKDQHIAFALVSGGFTFFTERLQKQLNIDFTLANVLEENNDLLTGKVLGNIVGAEAKAAFLKQLCEKLDITLDQTIAIGDGANDLLMMKEAGLSIAYHAKPAVQKQADVSINFGGLDKVLDFIAGD